VTVPDVVVVRWPDEEEKAAHLRVAGVPVLYLVGPEDEPPEPSGCLEDWVRVPDGDRDLRARLAFLEARAASHHGPPFVDDDDQLHHRGRAIRLDPREARIARALTANLGAVVSDGELLQAVGDAGEDAPSLRAEIARLRARVRLLHLTINRVRRSGYMLLPVRERAGS
jgi:DNA-binding response OmpR family regulator